MDTTTLDLDRRQLADLEPDQIFALIDAHRAAYKTYSDDNAAVWSALNVALVAYAPTTLAGCIAMLRYTLERDDLKDWCGEYERDVMLCVANALEVLPKPAA